MPKFNVYVTEELREEMRGEFASRNWSNLCQNAIRRCIAESKARTEDRESRKPEDRLRYIQAVFASQAAEYRYSVDECVEEIRKEVEQAKKAKAKPRPRKK